MISSINFACKVCGKNVNNVMIEPFNMTFVTVGFTLIAITLIVLIKFLQNSIDPWYCIFQFNSMESSKNFSMCVSNLHNNNNPVKTLNNESSLLLKPSENLKLLVDQFYNASRKDNTDPENVVQSKYYDIDELLNMKIPNKDKSLALFHINACSLNKNVDDLEHLLTCTNKNFD